MVRRMRRGLLKDLANTPTQIACGWRLYGDLARLRQLSGIVVMVDLLTGQANIDGRLLVPPPEIAEETSRWLRDRLERDGVPSGTVTAATLALRLEIDKRHALLVECATTLSTQSRTFESLDSTRWAQGD